MQNELNGIPYYINPLLVEENTIRRYLKDTPQEYIVADSIQTIKNLVEAANGGR